MLRRLALPTGLLLLSSVASTQTVAPVTVAEADAALQRVDASIRQVLKLKPAKKKALGPNRAITRAEVVARMDEMFTTYQSQLQY